MQLIEVRSLLFLQKPSYWNNVHVQVSIGKIQSLEGNLIEVHDIKLPVGKSYKEAVLKVLGV